jgi:hypothetical protein
MTETEYAYIIFRERVHLKNQVRERGERVGEELLFHSPNIFLTL